MTGAPVHIPRIETPRLILRAPVAADFDPLADFYASERSRFVGGPLSAELAWRALATELGHWALRGFGRFAVQDRETGKFVGLIGPWNPEGWPEAEIGWTLMTGFEGRGYATEAALAALEFAYHDLGWTTAISLIAPDNARSRRLAQRLGARPDGQFTHSRLGTVDIWRHMSGDDRAAGGIEAYA